MVSVCDVAIIGAGPYGLSLAAHLGESGIPFRIFGKPMHFWQAHMPEGMQLKSEGFASSLADPHGRFPLAAFCAERGIAYRHVGLPVPLETFIAYGTAFRERFVPEVDTRAVAAVAQRGAGFELRLSDGSAALARQVVVAVGVAYFAHVPPELERLPEKHLTHSSAHAALDRFRDRQVVVIGAGASAIDLAALLHRKGAHVELVARRALIDFHDPPRSRSVFDRIRAPRSGLGLGWKSLLATDFPLAFHAMPEPFRLQAVSRHLGPAPGWFMRAEVEGRIRLTLGARIEHSSLRGERVLLEVATAVGAEVLEADHVIAATGFRVDLRRLPFLGPEIIDQLRMVEQTPILSSRFESSLKGLYFVGPAAANSFGPLMRFGYGAGFVCRRLVPYLARQVARAGAATPDIAGHAERAGSAGALS